MDSLPSFKRRKKTARERRLQRERAEARLITKLLQKFELLNHRGSRPTQFAGALASALKQSQSTAGSGSCRQHHEPSAVLSPGVFIPTQSGDLRQTPLSESALPFTPCATQDGHLQAGFDTYRYEQENATFDKANNTSDQVGTWQY